MCKKNTVTFLAVLFILLNTSFCFSDPWSGSGTASDPYLVYNADDLEEIGSNSFYYSCHFKLMSNINLQSRSYNQAIIAFDTDNSTDDFDGAPFLGTIDGDGHFINNFQLVKPNKNSSYELRYFGLIGKAVAATIKNLELKNASIDFNQSSTAYKDTFINGGILVGRANSCLIDNCKINGNISTGNHQGTVASNIGGLVGYSKDSQINNCHVRVAIDADIMISGNGYTGPIGGLCGTSVDSSKFTNNKVYAYIMSSTDTGGLAGSVTKGQISNCSFNGFVHSNNCGGLIGIADETDVNSCSNDSAIYDAGAYSGGLIGKAVNASTILNCYSLGSVKSFQKDGGIVGKIQDSTVQYCYSATRMLEYISGTTDSGGIAGHQTNSTITDCYYDPWVTMALSQVGNDSIYIVPELSDGLDMQIKATYTGWDFEDAWFIIEGRMYPILRWQATAYLGDNNVDGKVDYQDLAGLAQNWLKSWW